MRRAATSIRVFAWYLFAVGAALLAVPNVVLPLLGIAPTTEPWIRVVGLLAGVIGYYYLVLIRAGMPQLLRATVPPRLVAAATFITIALLGLGPAALHGFALVDVTGALWTLWAVRTDARDVHRAAAAPHP